MQQKKTKIPLNGRGTAMVTAAPMVFGVCEAIFHANPIVGGALAVLGGAIAYRHYDDVESVVGQVAEGALIDYAPKTDTKRASAPTKKNIGVQENEAKIMIGTDKTGKERGRPLERLKNTLILGLPGQGKSSLACWLISQMVEQGARIIIIDRHARSDESLAAMLSPFERSFLMQPAYTYDDMEVAIEFAENLLNQRMEGQADVDFPIILAIDEFTDLMKKAAQSGPIGRIMQRMAEVVESYNAMGRKYECFSLCVGQLSNASRTGGTEIRELFATKLILGMQESQARMVVSKEAATRVARLNVGECMVSWEGRDEPFKVTFPNKNKAYYQGIAKKLTAVSDPYRELTEMPEIDPVDSRYGNEIAEPALVPIVPIVPDKGRKADEIPDDIAILLWNNGHDSRRKLAKALDITENQASHVMKRIGVSTQNQ